MSSVSKPVIFYTLLQRRLHWLVLLLVLGQYLLQWPMQRAMVAIERQETLSFLQFLVATVHTWGGIAIAALMLWRWQLRRRRVPVATGTLGPGRERLVHMHHVSLYVALVLMAFTGVLHYYLGVEVAARWHEWGKWLLAALIGIHVVGALSHLRHEQSVLHRMMGRGSLR